MDGNAISRHPDHANALTRQDIKSGMVVLAHHPGAVRDLTDRLEVLSWPFAGESPEDWWVETRDLITEVSDRLSLADMGVVPYNYPHMWNNNYTTAA